MFSFVPEMTAYGSIRPFIPKERADAVRQRKIPPVWQAAIRNDWANNRNDCLMELQNGDLIIVFAENAVENEKQKIAFEKELCEFNAMMHEKRSYLRSDIFNDADVLSIYSQNYFNHNPVVFFNEAGFPSKSTTPEWFDAKKKAEIDRFFSTRPVSAFFPLYDEDKLNKTLQPEGYILPYESAKRPVRRDILYAGAVDLDDTVHVIHFKYALNEEEIFCFKGAQKDLHPALWAAFLKDGHKCLMMRPEYGAN